MSAHRLVFWSDVRGEHVTCVCGWCFDDRSLPAVRMAAVVHAPALHL